MYGQLGNVSLLNVISKGMFNLHLINEYFITYALKSFTLNNNKYLPM